MLFRSVSQSRYRTFGLDGLWSLGVYEGALRKAIVKLKYKWVSEVARDLVDITVEYWAKNSPILLEEIKKNKQSLRSKDLGGQFWIVSSVPLHPRRQNFRGFNQSELLGKMFASKLGLPYQVILKRVRNTTPQMKLLSHQRKQNIKNAFSFQSSAVSFQQDAKILLIDDVWPNVS